MKKFRFRLQPVMTIRKQAERLKQKEFAAALKVLQRCRNDIAATVGTMEETRSSMREAEGRHIDMTILIMSRRHLNYLEVRLSSLFEEHNKLARGAEAKRLELVEAAKKRKSLDKLREKQLTDYNYEAAREERRFFDEVGGVRAAVVGRTRAIRTVREAGQ